MEKAFVNKAGQRIAADGKYIALKTYDAGPKLVLKGQEVVIGKNSLATELLAAGLIAPAKLQLKENLKPNSGTTEPAKPAPKRRRKPRKK